MSIGIIKCAWQVTVLQCLLFLHGSGEEVRLGCGLVGWGGWGLPRMRRRKSQSTINYFVEAPTCYDHTTTAS